MKNSKRISDYAAQFERVFGAPLARIERIKAAPETKADRCAGEGNEVEDARPTLGIPAGAAFLLTASAVVHEILGLREIRDPGRWLRRHGAPAALDTGHAKRYLAADVLDWASKRFAGDATSKRHLADLASSLRSAMGKSVASVDARDRVTLGDVPGVMGV
jgi:hypothetical protein